MLDSLNSGVGRDRRSSRKRRRLALGAEPLETRALMDGSLGSSVWTGYWNTNVGVLIVGPLLPAHESPYPQLDYEVLDGGWANANSGAPLVPTQPTDYLTGSLNVDPTTSPVFTGEILTVSSEQVGTFTFTMNMNPGYPTTPDSFTGTLTVGGQVTTIQGVYAGDQENTSGYIIPGSDAIPPRPRPDFGDTTTPPAPPASKFPFQKVAELTAELRRLKDSLSFPYRTLSHENADAKDIVSNGSPHQAAEERRKLVHDANALSKLITTGNAKETEAWAFVSGLANPDNDVDISMVLTAFKEANNSYYSAAYDATTLFIAARSTVYKLEELAGQGH
jgi:hypothetical protein